MPITFQHRKLPNGLDIVAETNPDAHTAAVGFFVRTGARDEEQPVMGVSHFLEHMMFKGTARRTADDVNREFDEIGANYNAWTSHENTVYYAQVLPEYLPRAVDLIGDMLRPALREDDFTVEKKVILEEIGMYEDRPQWRVYDALFENYFHGHPLGFRVLGTTDSINALGVDQMRGYFGHRYSPDNITVAAAGRIDFDKLAADIETVAGGWSPTGAKRTYNAPKVGDGVHAMADPKLHRHYAAMMCPGPDAQDDRRYAAKILADLLGDDEGSRLYWALVDPGLADEAAFEMYPQDHVGSFYAWASCDPDRAEEVERILLDTLDHVGDELDDAEIDRAKNKIATGATLSGESPAGRMRALGHQWQYLGKYRTLKEEIDRLMAVTRDDVEALIDAYPFRPRTIVRLGPK